MSDIADLLVKGGGHPGPPPRRERLPECEHIHLRFVWRVFNGANQVRRFGLQCTTCGEAGYKHKDGSIFSQWHGAEKWTSVLENRTEDCVPWNDALTQRLRDARNAFYNQPKPDWWAWYNSYLASTAWKTLRLRVLARDKSRCQQCGMGASEVHHITYDRVGYEDMGDLTSVCGDCHRILHQWQP